MLYRAPEHGPALGRAQNSRFNLRIIDRQDEMGRSPEEIGKDFDDKFSSGDIAGAEAIIRDAVTAHPDNASLSHRLLLLVERKDGQQGALPLARTMLEKFPTVPVFSEILIRALTFTGHEAEAEVLSESALKNFPDDVWIKVARASLYSHKQDWPAALQCWRSIVKDHPGLAFAHEAELNALLQSGGDAEMLAVHYAMEWPDSRLFPIIWADYPMRRHNRFAAAQRWADVARAHKNWPDAAYRAAEIYSSCDAHGNGLDVLQDCVDRDDRYYEEAFTLLLRGKRYERALSIYSEENFPRTAERLAQLLIGSNDTESLKAAVGITAPQILAEVTVELLLTVANLPILAPSQAAKIGALLPGMPGLSDLRPTSDDRPFDLSPHHGDILTISRLIDASGSRLSRTAADVESLLRYVNAFRFDRKLRAYQAQLSERGTIDFTHTLLDSFRLAGSAHVLHSSLAICATDGSERVWLTTVGHGLAHEIGLLYVASADVAFVTETMSESDAREICRLIRGFEADIKDGKHRAWYGVECPAPLLLIGHNNFAHFVWNELPALCELERGTKHESLQSATFYEPFGPMHFTIPAISEIPEKNTFCRHICFYASSLVMTDEARELAVRICREHAHAAPVTLKPDGPAVLISLRVMYRHPVNQVDLIKSLCDKFEQWSQRPTIVIDGFSVPPDLDAPGRYDAGYLYKQRDAVCDLAKNIIGENETSIRIVDTSMLNLSEFIATLSSLPALDDTYYVSVLGTQQHKLAWLRDIPGITHSNRDMAEAVPTTEWQQTQAFTKMESVLVPHHLIADAVTQNERQDQRVFRDYAFGDVDACATWISDQLLAMREREAAGRRYRAHLARMSG